jgi:hypothetical protein
MQRGSLDQTIVLFFTFIGYSNSSVQNFAKNKVVTFLEGKIKPKQTTRIEIGLPKKVILEGIYFEDVETLY